ncbi:MAG: hypothetical protein ACRDH9_03210 [Actinomycetota bacterium]
MRGKKIADWMLKYSDGTALIGWSEILEHFGSAGWELVSVVGEYYGLQGQNCTQMRIFFKKPKPE